MARATNFDFRITKEEAQRLLFHGEHEEYNFEIMCKEYGYDFEDDEWVGLNMDDLDEDGTLHDGLETFEIWFELGSTKEKQDKIIKELGIKEQNV